MSVSAAFIKAVEPATKPRKRAQAEEPEKQVDEQQKTARFLPREHGATAMLFTPMVCAAILARTWNWMELAAFAAAFAALAAKDPMVILARQQLVWKTPHAETPVAARWFVAWMLVLATSGLVLLFTWPLESDARAGAWCRRVFDFGCVGKREKSPTLYAVSNCECCCAHVQLAGNIAVGHRCDSKLVLVAVVIFGVAGRGGNTGGSCKARCAHCIAQSRQGYARVSAQGAGGRGCNGCCSRDCGGASPQLCGFGIAGGGDWLCL
jgi:hypothetical protein